MYINTYLYISTHLSPRHVYIYISIHITDICTCVQMYVYVHANKMFLEVPTHMYTHVHVFLLCFHLDHQSFSLDQLLVVMMMQALPY